MIRTKEDVNLLFIQDPTGTLLKRYMLDYLVVKNDETREAVLETGDRDVAMYYAKYVDECPRDDTREYLCDTPWNAYCYAVNVDKCPRDDTRAKAFENEYSKHYYMNFEAEYKCLKK